MRYATHSDRSERRPLRVSRGSYAEGNASDARLKGSKKRIDSLYQLDPDADADEAYTSAYRLPTAPALAKPDDSWPYCDACGYAGLALPPSRYCPCAWDTRDTAQNARSTP